jgi:hypothetical protein
VRVPTGAHPHVGPPQSALRIGAFRAMMPLEGGTKYMHSRISWLWRSAGLLLVGFLVVITAGACGGDGGASPEEIQAVEDIARQVFESSGDNADFFFGHVTDNLIDTVLFSTRDECQANAAECIGDPGTVEGFSGTEIDGDNATSTVTSDFGTFEIGLMRQDDDSLQAASDEAPEGAASVDLGLSEFAFQFNADDIPADGNFVFHATNDGAQVHEVAVAPIPADVDLLEALDTIDEGSVVAFKLFVVPGQEVDVAFEAPLEPGRYALVCFFPDTDDPEGTPHALKGMRGEFTIE